MNSDMVPNPFESLYVTETMSPDEFVSVFSPMLVPETNPLFEPGNAIVTGRQGCGKSMLLNLLKPEIRLAYARADTPFPLRGPLGSFIGCGINLVRSGAIDFGQRSFVSGGKEGEFAGPEELGLFFADFLNYWVIRDLIRSVELLGQSGLVGPEDLNLDARPRTLNAFASALARSDAWMGYLSGTRSIGTLKTRLEERLQSYRDYLYFNTRELPNRIRSTTTAVGEPLSIAADALRECGVIGPQAHVHVRIDQYETLADMERALHPVTGGEEAGALQAAVHRLMGQRERRISFKVGTRRWAWPDSARLLGTSAVLEEYRDYIKIDLDAVLRDSEHSAHRFRDFADDVLRRRLENTGFHAPPNVSSVLIHLFGRAPSPEEAARQYVRTARTSLRLPAGWTAANKAALLDVATTNPLSAELGRAWIIQHTDDPVTPDRIAAQEWMSPSQQYWRKDRIPMALFRLASSNRQRLRWSGGPDIIQLSDANILVFVSICQKIWLAWMRHPTYRVPHDGGGYRPPRHIDPGLQDEGIREASYIWYRKLADATEGTAFQTFVQGLSGFARERLKADDAMSNPGDTGISLAIDAVRGQPTVRRFLETASAWGALTDVEHPSKSRGQSRRMGYYLYPILCPYLQVPSKNVKHGYYLNDLALMEKYIRQARHGTVPKIRVRSSGSNLQPRLIEEPE